MRVYAKVLLILLLFVFVPYGATSASVPRWPEPAWFARFQQQPAPAPVTQPPADAGLTAAELHIFNAINHERTSRGLPPLVLDPALVELARRKSRDMAANNYVGHQSPVYGSPFEMMRNAGIRYNYAGENIARTSTPENAVRLFMNSRQHRNTLLSHRFSRTGIGVVQAGRQLLVTQMFIGFMR